jgi:hypothetical protein
MDKLLRTSSRTCCSHKAQIVRQGRVINQSVCNHFRCMSLVAITSDPSANEFDSDNEVKEGAD